MQQEVALLYNYASVPRTVSLATNLLKTNKQKYKKPQTPKTNQSTKPTHLQKVFKYYHKYH